jgi:DNA-directed RNA polymerase specialized sigma24 family protein
MTLLSHPTLPGAVAVEHRAIAPGAMGPMPAGGGRRGRRAAAGEPGALPTGALARRCREEAARFARGEPACEAFAHELLRRAVCDGDQAAWAAAVAQYRALVLAWVRRHPAYPVTDEGDDYWVNRTFERFWGAVGPARFRAFPGLAALLQYLKLCAGSVLLDEARRRAAAAAEPLTERAAGPAGGRSGEEAVLGELAGRELWRAIEREARGEDERLVARLCLGQGLTPREVCARHPERFGEVAEVYRVKRRLLDRLGRSPAIRRFLD